MSKARPTPAFAARVLSVQALYQAGLRGEVDPEPTVAEFLGPAASTRLATIGARSVDAPLFTALVRSAFTQGDDLDTLILGVLSPRWHLDRLDPVVLALLRVASYELSQPQVPAPQKLIAQYVRIAEGFFEGREPGLVNATLDALARALHPEAFEPQVPAIDGRI